MTEQEYCDLTDLQLARIILSICKRMNDIESASRIADYAREIEIKLQNEISII